MEERLGRKQNDETKRNELAEHFGDDLLFADNFDNAINQLSNAMLSSLTSAINNPDNSGNTIAAEYSVFIPQPVTQDESTSTEDDDTETY